MIVAFLVTSTLACAVTLNKEGDCHTASSFQAKPESPYSPDQQLPIEEKEKEFDEDQADEKNGFDTILNYICDVRIWQHNDHNAKLILLFDTSASTHIPLFLTHHALLI